MSLWFTERIFQKFVLEGIIYDKQSSYAIIGGEIVGKNERIGDFEITNITQDTVEMININDKAKVTLSLP